MEISYKTHEANLAFLEPAVVVGYQRGIWFTSSYVFQHRCQVTRRSHWV